MSQSEVIELDELDILLIGVENNLMRNKGFKVTPAEAKAQILKLITPLEGLSHRKADEAVKDTTSTPADQDKLREKILNLLHRTEGDKEFLDKHLNPNKNGPCNMEIAAPRCAKRVRAIEALILSHQTQYTNNLKELGEHNA